MLNDASPWNGNELIATSGNSGWPFNVPWAPIASELWYNPVWLKLSEKE